MFGSALLEVAIGVVTLYLVLSLVCSSAQEALESFLKNRGRNLEQGIKNLLNDDDWVKKLYEHPLIFSLYQGEYKAGGRDLPSYIPSQAFAGALFDLAKNAQQIPANVADIRAAVSSNDMMPTKLKAVMLHALDAAQGDVQKAHQFVENWFDQGMDRASGWYKRYAHQVMMVIALIIAVGFNVDTFRVANELYRNQNLRAAVVAQSESIVEETKASNEPQGAEGAKTSTGAQATSAVSRLENAGLPIGWKGYQLETGLEGVKTLLGSLIGWLVTAFAISFGAPFWFSVLGKLISARAPSKAK